MGPLPSQTKSRPKRRRMLLPGFQLRLVLLLLGASSLSLVAEMLFLANEVARLATTMPAGGEYLAQELPHLLLRALVLSLALLLPALFAVGIAATFPVAGPIYRFQMHLAAVARGETAEPCRIRRGDHLQELCELINAALAAEHARGLREAEEQQRAGEAGAPDSRAA